MSQSTFPDQSAPSAGAEDANPSAARPFNRRALLGAALSAAIPALALTRGHGRSLGSARAQSVDVTPSPLTVNLTIGGTPVASPAASPVASPVAAKTIGQLVVIEDQRPVDPAPPVAGGDLRLFIPSGTNDNFNPAAYRQDFQIPASYLDPLVWIDEVTMEPRPWLAASWKWSRKNTRITYTLRDDVLWHDGSKLTAKDVAFSLYVYRDDIDSGVSNFFINMTNAQATDDLTVVVDLSAPDANWLLNASSQFVIQRKQYIKHWSSQTEGQATLSSFDWSDVTPQGTGPWKITRRGNSTIAFGRNDGYFVGPPLANTLTLATQEDPAKRLADWQAGKVDLLWTRSFADVQTASSNPGTVYVADAAAVMFAAFNFNNPNRADPTLFADLELRAAMSLAIDREKYAQAVFGGYAKIDRAGTVAQPWANNPAAANPARDVEAAKQRLAKAGYKDTDGDTLLESPSGEKLDFRLIVLASAKPEFLAVLASMASDLREVGIKVNVRQLSDNRFANEWIETHNFDLIAYAYDLFAGFTDFDLYGSAWDIRQNPQGWNPGGYADADADNAIRDILGASKPAEQLAALQTLQDVINNDLFALWFGFPREFVLARPGTRGFQPNKLWQTWDTRKLWHG